MIKIKIRQKRGELETWHIVLGAIVAIVVASLVIYLVKGGLFTQQKNVNLLSSCKSLGGTCLNVELTNKDCPSGYTNVYEYGCPDGEDKSLKTCCVPKEKPVQNKDSK